MSEKFRDKVREMIKEGEGCVPHMYLDTVGKVTVGVGNMLKKASSAANLPFVLEATGAVASNEQVEVEFDFQPTYFAEVGSSEERFCAIVWRGLQEFST